MLDDGFQHLQLARAVDIVIVSAKDLAIGRFRGAACANPVAALRFANAIVIDEDAGAVGTARERIRAIAGRDVPIFTLTRQSRPPVPFDPSDPAPSPGSRVLALSGIAGPERFQRSLSAAGFAVADAMAFRDHHWFAGATALRDCLPRDTLRRGSGRHDEQGRDASARASADACAIRASADRGGDRITRRVCRLAGCAPGGGARVSEPRIQHRFEYAAVATVRGLVRWMPHGAVRAFGRAIGGAWAIVDRRHRRLAVDQIHAACPTKSMAECRRIARDTFRHFGELFAVLLKFSTLTVDELRGRVVFEGAERVRDALALGKGVFALLGALWILGVAGAWRIRSRCRRCRCCASLDNPLLHPAPQGTSSRAHLIVIYKKGAVRRAARAQRERVRGDHDRPARIRPTP